MFPIVETIRGNALTFAAIFFVAAIVAGADAINVADTLVHHQVNRDVDNLAADIVIAAVAAG